jgi:hypothetical protein
MHAPRNRREPERIAQAVQSDKQIQRGVTDRHIAVRHSFGINLRYGVSGGLERVGLAHLDTTSGLAAAAASLCFSDAICSRISRTPSTSTAMLLVSRSIFLIRRSPAIAVV